MSERGIPARRETGANTRLPVTATGSKGNYFEKNETLLPEKHVSHDQNSALTVEIKRREIHPVNRILRGTTAPAK